MRPSRSRLALGVRHAVLALVALAVLTPLLWALRLSFMAPDDMFASEFHFLPTHWIGFENYVRALTASPLASYLVNGAIVCSAIVAAQLAVAIPCGYALAKTQFRGKRAFWTVVLIGLIVPPPALALPLFVMAAQAGLVDTYLGLVVPWTISCLGIFLFRQVLLRVPDEIVDAARLDGLGEWELLPIVVVPIIKPAIGAFIMISFVTHWNDLLWPSVVVASGTRATPPFGVMLFQSQEIGSEYGPLMAGTLLIAAPLLTVFLFTQRHFLDSFGVGLAK